MTVRRRAGSAPAVVGALAVAVLAAWPPPPALAQPAPPTAAPAVAREETTARARARADALRGQVAVLRQRLAQVAEQTEQAYARLGESVSDYVQAERAAEAAASAEWVAQGRHRARVRALYARGGAAVLYASLLDASDPADVVTRYRAVESVLGEDRAAGHTATQRVSAAAGALATHGREVEDRVALERRARTLAAQTQALFDREQALLAGADAKVRRLLQRDRQRSASAALAAAARRPADATGYMPRANLRYSCPVGPTHSFIDTWGAARSGGRRHQGTDVFAPYASPVYAVADGVVDRAGDDGGRGGLRVWVRADGGDAFYFAHNSENLVRSGQRVRAGQVIARVGTSGNAAGTPPHVHFESHPRGGRAASSYPFLRAVCG